MDEYLPKQDELRWPCGCGAWARASEGPCLKPSCDRRGPRPEAVLYLGGPSMRAVREHRSNYLPGRTVQLEVACPSCLQGKLLLGWDREKYFEARCAACLRDVRTIPAQLEY